ncbi:HAD family hydrolase [Streptomyces sp. NBC_01500]|uniref:HAD family hydrolase n=1 Tax=Streptomyces sp. NBC_01500 TaxID=2903886 RepID=UPI002254F709|nr:HAD-IA family hydrolase [Streptomyces sp. NBC_01500]MCX4549449.1 HAD-IA family hydrolase [Streptomyces sp. NBC_01500]
MNPTHLADVLRPVKHVFFDFDGPVCSVFAGLPASEVARRLYETLRPALAPGDPDGWALENDPLALLRRVADVRPDLAGQADETLARLEVEAVVLAERTTGGESTIRACVESGRSVWIISNNSGDAIRSYLTDHGLGDDVAGVFGRVPGDPTSMKPNPRLLLDALSAASAAPASCIFIGDAARDVEAGKAAEVATIGYANKPGKEAVLAAAGAVVVTDSMSTIADALR